MNDIFYEIHEALEKAIDEHPSSWGLPEAQYIIDQIAKKHKDHDTNFEKVQSMNFNDFCEWYWWMLDKTKWYTDSREGLKQWLLSDEDHCLPFI